MSFFGTFLVFKNIAHFENQSSLYFRLVEGVLICGVLPYINHYHYVFVRVFLNHHKS